MQTAIKHYPLTTNQSEMFQEWEEDTKMTQFNICGYYLIEGHPLIAKRMRDVLKPFDPFGEPLVRAEFIETPSRQYLCFEFFHLLADGLTYQSFVNDIKAAYAGLDLKPQSLEFFEYAEPTKSVSKTCPIKSLFFLGRAT